ncbi:MAG: FtsQ-type POTRA domain-containing protein [Gammaproteobacteria bacterium]|nr:FtsQ-type POTRA domain-containing protein [Gammaproteobacteria bacterium]MDH3536430.1 FtsQ-type POTRA domain-containing protein [Gammaproteobacteria bacterium]
MFGFRKQGAQAKRKMSPVKSSSFRWRKSYNWIFLLLPIALAGHYLSRMNEMMPIRSIQLAGSFENLNQREVEQALQPYIGQGFFALDIHELQETLNARPWTESVSIRRVWPDKLRVTITEKKPLARWDDRHLLSESARVYPADTAPFAQLPLVHAHSHAPEWALHQFARLEAQFESVDEKLVALRVDSRGAIDIELLNGLQIKLGRSDVDRKIERLVSIYRRQILPRREQILRLDLRYSNGFAVAWKKEVLQGRDEASIWSNTNV